MLSNSSAFYNGAAAILFIPSQGYHFIAWTPTLGFPTSKKQHDYESYCQLIKASSFLCYQDEGEFGSYEKDEA